MCRLSPSTVMFTSLREKPTKAYRHQIRTRACKCKTSCYIKSSSKPALQKNRAPQMLFKGHSLSLTWHIKEEHVCVVQLPNF